MTSKQTRERGRITIPDLFRFMASFAFLAPLAVVLYAMLDMRVDLLSTGELLLFRAIVPLCILMLLTFAYLRATEGL